MVEIAANDGELHIHAFQHIIPAVAAVLLAVAGAIGVLASADTPRWRGTLFLATAGCATAVAALTRVLFQAPSHSGSDYSINKYSFGVITLLVFALRRRGQRNREGPTVAGLSGGVQILAAPALALAATVFMHAEHAERLDKFVEYQKQGADLRCREKGPCRTFSRIPARATPSSSAIP